MDIVTNNYHLPDCNTVRFRESPTFQTNIPLSPSEPSKKLEQTGGKLPSKHRAFPTRHDTTAQATVVVMVTTARPSKTTQQWIFVFNKDWEFLEYLSQYQEVFCSLELAVDKAKINSLFKLLSTKMKLQASSDLCQLHISEIFTNIKSPQASF